MFEGADALRTCRKGPGSGHMPLQSSKHSPEAIARHSAAASALKPPLVLVLTCRHSPPDRIASARAQLLAILPDARVEVVDGLVDTDAATRKLIDPWRVKLLSKRPPTLREVAAYGTHRMAWARLVQSGEDCAIVLEDDFAIIDPDQLRALVASLPGVMALQIDMLKLFDFPRAAAGGWALTRNLGPLTLCRWASPRAGLVGYVLTADGARRFLSRSRVYRVVDEDIKYFWELGLEIWSLRPGPVIDASARMGGSLLEQTRLDVRRQRSLRRSLHGMVLALHRRLRNALAFGWACLALTDAKLQRFDNGKLP